MGSYDPNEAHSYDFSSPERRSRIADGRTLRTYALRVPLYRERGGLTPVPLLIPVPGLRIHGSEDATQKFMILLAITQTIFAVHGKEIQAAPSSTWSFRPEVFDYPSSVRKLIAECRIALQRVSVESVNHREARRRRVGGRITVPTSVVEPASANRERENNRRASKADGGHELGQRPNGLAL